MVDITKTLMLPNFKETRTTETIESRIIRTPLPGEPDDETENNNIFNVEYFIPDDFTSVKDTESSSEHHILIMTNGMGEYSEDFYLGEGGICKQLSDLGIATVFMPLPFHFWRMSNKNQEYVSNTEKTRGFHPAVSAVNQHKMRFFLGYEQLWFDIAELTEKISLHVNEKLLPSNLKISLWGYSIGGLPILSRFLTKPDLYNACILFHSGANLENLGYNRFLFSSEKDWEDLRHYYRNKTHENELPAIQRDAKRKFDQLFLNENVEELHNELTKWRNKILLFVGGRDDIMSMEAIHASIVPPYWLPIHIIPGLKHELIRKDFVDNWMDYEISVLSKFISKRPKCKGEV